MRYILHYKYGKAISIDDVEYRNDAANEYYNLGESTEEESRRFKHLTDEEIAEWFKTSQSM